MEKLLTSFALLFLGLPVARAQGQSPVPDAPAPTQTSPQPSAKPNSSPSDDKFAFPEEQKKPATSNGDKATDFPFPASTNIPVTPGTPAADATDEPPVPKGYSTSESVLHDEGSGVEPPPASPARAAKDISVARFYWNLGNYEGAYLRYKDAVIYAPQDAMNWFLLAESERMLGRYSKARADYQHYLQLEPNGNKSRDAQKALKTMPQKDKPAPTGPGPRVP